MYVHNAWNLTYATEMTTATIDGCIEWIFENCYLMGSFDSERYKSMKGNFSDGGNE